LIANSYNLHINLSLAMGNLNISQVPE